HVTGVQTCALPISSFGESSFAARLFFVQRRPADARGNSRPVVFALDHVLRAAVVEAENLVVDIQAIHDELKAIRQSHAALGIELQMRVEIVVARSEEHTSE